MLTPVMIVVSFALVIMSSVKLSLIIAATVPFIILGVVVVAKVSGPVSEKQQTALDGLNRIFKENLTGLRASVRLIIIRGRRSVLVSRIGSLRPSPGSFLH